MTTDTVTRIKNAEAEADRLVERARADAAQTLRDAQTDGERRIKDESEKLRRKFDDEVAAAENEAASLCNEEEIAAYSDADKFKKDASARLTDAVRFIVGGIIGKWQ